MGLVLLVLVACGQSGEVDFPSRLAPLEEVNLAPAVAPVDGDAYPEVLSVVSGDSLVDDEGNTLYWAHARGYVQADLQDVWDAAREPAVCVDRREVDEWSVLLGTVPEFVYSYTIANTVHDVITVAYDVTWVHEQQDGVESPTLVVAQWDKTGGTAVIDILRGSLVLRSVAPGVTEIELIEHLKAAMRDEETVESYLADFYADLLAVVHDEPLVAF